MSLKARKRERLAQLFGRQSSSASTPELQPHCIETLACIRIVLNLAEKALDGCPIWGPKAAVAATAEALKAIQKALENKGSIQDVVDAVRKTVETLAPSVPILPASVSPELKSRIMAHVAELEKIRASTKKWTEEEKSLKRRLLDAGRVAKELKGVMDKIHHANGRLSMETAIRTEVKIESIQEGVGHLNMKADNIREGQGDVKNDDLLDRLRPVKEAFHDASNASQTCLAGTREQLLANIYEWFQNTEPSRERVFWLSGLAGTGKTTVARTIADRAHAQGRLAAAFFFSRNIAATRAPTAIIPTLAYQLAQYQSSFRSYICSAVASDKDVRDRAIVAQSRSLLDDLSTLNVPNGPLLVVLDALDECHIENGCEGGDAIPLLLARLAPIPFIKVLITSRAEDTIKHMFAGLTNKLALHDIEADVVQSDILHYLEHSLAEQACMRNLPAPFPKADVLEELVRRSGALFIYAATVVKWVSEPKACLSLRLEQILEQDADELSFQYKMLDTMYAQILAQAAETSGNPRTHERALKNVLSAVLLLQEPMHAPALASLAGEEKRASTILPLLSAVLLAKDKAPVRLFHPSFPDFIMDEDRCQDRKFAVVPSEGHLQLAIRCLDIMNASLCQDICDIKNHSLLNNEIDDLEQRLASSVSDELRYACKYWHVHLGFVSILSSVVTESLKVFCQHHLLHWVELLSLMDALPALTVGIPPLLSFLQRCGGPRQHLCHILLSDTERLVSVYGKPIGLSALQVYHSAVATMPACPLWEANIRCHTGIPQLASARATNWGSAGRIVIDAGPALLNPSSIALSPGGRFLALGHLAQTQVWDMTKRDELYVKRGTGWIVMFSPNGQSLASAGTDNRIQLWATTNGILRYVLDANGDHLTCIAFSPDNQHIASGYSASVRLWDMATGALEHVMGNAQELEVKSIAFSPNSTFLAWGNLNGGIDVRNIDIGMHQHVDADYDGYFRTAALVSRHPVPRILEDQDSPRLVGPHEFVVEDWHVRQGMSLQRVRAAVVCTTGSITAVANELCDRHESLQGAIGCQGQTHIAFSPTNSPADTARKPQDAITISAIRIRLSSIALSLDGKLVASGSADGMVRLWDATTGNHLRLIGHHYSDVSCMAFSTDNEVVASCSDDKMVRTWCTDHNFHISKKKLGKCAEGKDNRDNLSTFEWEEATARARLSQLSFLWANLPNPFC